ncbi:hypothetical protein ACA30_08480 [Virgibacillus soli]|uniref:WYL domain-containing protein n=1 Tax=Lederbergia galactosidilytica TaxID=217031 RepID=A0A0Q9Y9L6_9BACI|nr:hypothetical protein ACA29_11190 [Lederbergia galactosidilytica]KRG15189.1 hypothetical protein ACA30_08480 [Virgibacillus soli]MBP1913154.1 putative DNA-binding transcriptional regulator YafY [Lederbergia galactosidilytica]OAK67845.1 hypothetical protein ABB05_17490 [Lederbergia galactosidilytica]
MNNLLKRACNHKTPIQIIYIDSQNHLSQRTIKVLAITNTFIKAYCYSKRQFRTFKMENILSVGKKAV